MKVTVVGAGAYGSTLAASIALAGWADEVVMTDVVVDRPQGLALDMMQSRPILGFATRVTGSNGYGETAGSDIAVITAGLARRPGMSRTDLTDANAEIVAGVTRAVVEASPDVVLIVVTNPLDEMAALAAKVSELPPGRVMGQAGMLDTARFRHFVAERLDVSPATVEAITLGSHGDTMVPVPSLATVGGRPLGELLDRATIDELVARTRDGGAEIVGLLRTGSAFYAPAAAAAAMAAAVAGDTGEIMPVCTWVDGAYGIDGVYLGVPARLGRQGVKEVVELALAPGELADLRRAADDVRARQAALGLIGDQAP